MGDRMITRGQSKRFVGYFNTVAKSWELTGPEQMKLLGLSTLPDLALYLSGKRILTDDMFLRIHYLNQIYTDLHNLLPAASAANSWVRRPNSHSFFKGRTALYCMMNGKVSIKVVSGYLQGVMQGQ